MKKKNGFTLVELLATLVILGIIMTITIVTINNGFGSAKDKTETIFIKTIDDAMSIYLDSSAKGLSYQANKVGSIKKTHGTADLYKASSNVSFADIIASEYAPITADDLVNPASEKRCKTNQKVIEIYRDSDYVYYYRIIKTNLSKLDCFLNTSDDIKNLPDNVIW